jgi:hypothetical protein
MLLAGCGSSPKATPKGPTLPAVLAKAPAAPNVLKPLVSETTLGQTRVTSLKASLTGGRPDTIRVQSLPGFDGQVTVTEGTRIIFQSLHTAGVSVLEFGRRHLPVLLLQDSVSYCGSGGCATSAYTWSRTRHRMLPVPVPGTPAYRYDARRRQFVVTSLPLPGGLFGYVVPGGPGIIVHARTYDLWQHGITQGYGYAPGLSPTGGWVAVGKPVYGPSTAETGFTWGGPAQTVLALLDARALDFKAQVAQVSASSADASVIWRDLAPIGTWGGSLFSVDASPRVSTAGSTTVVTDRVAGLRGAGATATLQVYEVTASLTKAGSTYYVRTVHLAPVAVKVQDILQVLTIIRSDRSLLRTLAKAGYPALQVEAVGQRWQVDTASQGGQSVRPLVDIDAVTGAVRRAGANP